MKLSAGYRRKGRTKSRAMLHLVHDDREPESIDPAHLAGVLEGLDQARRREFATDEEVEAAFRRFGQ